MVVHLGGGRFSGVAKEAQYLVNRISASRVEPSIQTKRAIAR